MNWISVKDKLPPLLGEPASRLYGTMTMMKKHWMHLPAAPKE